MVYSTLQKNEDILEFIKKFVKENVNRAIYLSGDFARELLNVARKRRAEMLAENVTDKVILRTYSFKSGFGDETTIKIKDDFDNRANFQILSYQLKEGAILFSYKFNPEKALLEDKAIASTVPLVKEKI